MYNSDYNSGHYRRAPASPRISFSSDFVDIQQSLRQQEQQQQQRSASATAAASSSDFEFSVSNYSMMPADELLFQGRLLPFKDSHKGSTTLRDELLLEHDEENDDVSPLPSRPGRWKGFLGLKKSHNNNNASKNPCRNHGSSTSTRDIVADGKRPFGWSSSTGTRANSYQVKKTKLFNVVVFLNCLKIINFSKMFYS